MSFSPDGKYLTFFQRNNTGVHDSTFALYKIYWPTKQVELVVDIVKEKPKDDCFPGFYSISFPKRAWSSTSDTIFFSTAWGAKLVFKIFINF